jgi:hypothetical protein
MADSSQLEGNCGVLIGTLSVCPSIVIGKSDAASTWAMASMALIEAGCSPACPGGKEDAVVDFDGHSAAGFQQLDLALGDQRLQGILDVVGDILHFLPLLDSSFILRFWSGNLSGLAIGLTGNSGAPCMVTIGCPPGCAVCS